MLVRIYKSVHGKKFSVTRDGAGLLSCTCKSFVFGTTFTCRHIKAFLAEPSPFETLDWL